MELNDLEKMNGDGQYNQSRNVIANLETHKKIIESFKLQIKQTNATLMRIQSQMGEAEAYNRKDEVVKLKAEKEQYTDKLNQLKEALLKEQTLVKHSQEAIDKKFEILSKDPDLKAHLDEVISKKFTRQKAKKEKEKEEAVNKNNVLIKIQEEAKKNPNVMYLLGEIKKYNGQIEKATAIINDPAKSNDEKDKARTDLSQAQSFLSKSRGELANHFKGTVSKDVIEQITSYEGLEKQIKSNNRYIAGINKQIANYSTALDRISSRDNTVATTRFSSQESSQNLPTENLKWYNLIKRFKNWNSRRKAAYQQEENSEQTQTGSDSKKFKDSMKYDIVKDYEQHLETEYLKDAKIENKLNNQEHADR